MRQKEAGRNERCDKEIGAPEYRIRKFQRNFVLTPRGTMISDPVLGLRRHRSQAVSVKNLAKSNFKNDDNDDGDAPAGPEHHRVRLTEIRTGLADRVES